MSTLSIHFKGIQEKILEEITASGLAETKSEAVRMALLKFAVDFNLIDEQMMVAALRKDLQRDKKNIADVLKGIRQVTHAGISR